jgi:hypothetical protein
MGRRSFKRARALRSVTVIPFHAGLPARIVRWAARETVTTARATPLLERLDPTGDRRLLAL